MSSYESLARFYDELTEDVNYAAWADFYEVFFRNHTGLEIHTVLDLACGTGTLTRLMAERGYEMIGVDQSPEMLMEAQEKCMDVEGIRPLFLNQSMDELDLYGTIDACVCCLDSVNYVTDPKALQEALKRVQCFLMPGGLMIFDVRTPELFRSLDGQMFLDEAEDVFCVWRAVFDEAEKVCTYGFDLFERQKNGLWRREREEHNEYAYTAEELTEYLHQAGFGKVELYGNCQMRPPEAGEDRIVFVAKKDESWQMKSYES